jgi:hypothetical protein
MVQGDTLFLNSKYAEYNGNVKKSICGGEAFMNSPTRHWKRILLTLIFRKYIIALKEP